MSEESSRALMDALAKQVKAEGQADEVLQACLDEVASGLADRVDSKARGVAQAQPQVTKALGKEGVRTFRDELARASSVLEADLRGAIRKINWPMESHRVSRNRCIHDALFKYLHGPKVNAIATVFRKHGFDTGEADGHGQSLLSPQYLYDEDRFPPVVDALKLVADTRTAVALAIKADDRDVVDDLWGDGPAAARLPGTPSREW